MMIPYSGKGGVLSSAHTNALAIERIVTSTPFPERSKDHANFWTPEQWAVIEARWKAYRGPVKNIEHFALPIEHGYFKGEPCYTWIVYDHGTVTVDLMLESDLEQHSGLLLHCKPVKEIRGKQQIAPNAPCGCGSGRKSKRCCGGRV